MNNFNSFSHLTSVPQYFNAGNYGESYTTGYEGCYGPPQWGYEPYYHPYTPTHNPAGWNQQSLNYGVQPVPNYQYFQPPEIRQDPPISETYDHKLIQYVQEQTVALASMREQIDSLKLIQCLQERTIVLESMWEQLKSINEGYEASTVTLMSNTNLPDQDTMLDQAEGPDMEAELDTQPSQPNMIRDVPVTEDMQEIDHETEPNMTSNDCAVTLPSDINLSNCLDPLLGQAEGPDMEAENDVQPNQPDRLQNYSETSVDHEMKVLEDCHCIKPEESMRKIEKEIKLVINSTTVVCEREVLKLFDFIDPFTESRFTHNRSVLFILQEPKIEIEPCYGYLQNALREDHALHGIILIKLRAWKAFSRIG